MKLYTSSGETLDPPRQRLEQDLEGLQKVDDEAAFVGIQRSDGTFLQMRRLPIEYGDGSGTAKRATLPPDIKRMFLAFAAGEKDWDRGIAWFDAPKPRGLNRPVPLRVVLLAFLLPAAGFALYVWLRTH